MKPIVLSLIAPFALLTSTQSVAQEEVAPPSDESALGLADDMTGAELAALFEEMFAEPEFAKMLDELLADAFQVGEPESGWSERGVFLPELFSKRSGGLSGQILVSESQEISSIQQFGIDKASMPEGTFSYTLIDANPGPLRENTIIKVAAGVWLELVSSIERIGNAACYRPDFGVTVHSTTKASEWTVGDLGGIGIFYAMTPKFTEQEMCLVYSLREDGKVTSAGFTRSGEPYILMNAENEIFMIRPASEGAERIANLQSPLMDNLAEAIEAKE